MENKIRSDLSRKSFIKKLGTASAAVLGVPFLARGSSVNESFLHRNYPVGKKYAANDRVNLALIGAGGMGQGNTHTALRVDGIELVASCDLYDSRLERSKEHWGSDIFTTKDYREILDRDDVDAVIIATSDHYHERIAKDALAAGKAIYLEKPMVKNIEEGHALIEAEKNAQLPLIVGSQRTSSILYEKARDLIEAGEIGELNFVEGYWDRRSAVGAWQYSIPPSASEDNVDWDAYRAGMPDIPFDAKHFFRWRNYDDYGTGVAGDLFVHLFSGLHMIIGSTGPEKIMSTGALRYWKDGRDAEDVVLGIFDYPETDNHPAFNLSLRVNFADGSGGGSRIRLAGSEGVIDINWNNITLRKWNAPERPGMSIGDFAEDTRDEYQKFYEERYPESRAKIIEPNEFVYRAPDGYDDRYDHFVNFFNAIRNGDSVLQDSTFGLRACGPALMSSVSLRENRIVHWNPTTMNEA